MEMIRLGWPWSVLYELAGRIGGRPARRIRVIGRNHGPTAVFMATKRRPCKPRRQKGLLIMRLNWHEVCMAARLAAVALSALALAAVAIHLACGRKH